jgi:hypothetical protein
MKKSKKIYRPKIKQNQKILRRNKMGILKLKNWRKKKQQRYRHYLKKLLSQKKRKKELLLNKLQKNVLKKSLK